MQMPNLSETLGIATYFEPDGRIVIRLVGPLDAAGESRLVDEVVRADPQDGDVVELNLDEVTFIDSTGVGAVIYVSAFVRVRGGEFLIPAPRPHTVAAFELAGLDRYITDRAESSCTRSVVGSSAATHRSPRSTGNHR